MDLMQFAGDLRTVSASVSVPGSQHRVAYGPGAISATEIAALGSLFPSLNFQPLASEWLGHSTPNVDILIFGISAASQQDVAKVTKFLESCPSRLHVIVALREADVISSRALTRAGAADVIPLPASEATWALAIERLLARNNSDRAIARKAGQAVAILKAGGGVGATSLGVQVALSLAPRAGAEKSICFADLDVQFGAAALYFDLDQALTVSDCVAVGEVLEETQFATVLAAHKSGVRLLAAPRDVTPVDLVPVNLVDGLMGGLRRDFALTILDMPSVWTAWTNRMLQLADRIVLVTQLSVPHVHLVRRQLGLLSQQSLDRLPVTLVCNRVTGDQERFLSVKEAEKAIGRSFDLVIPEDVRAMGAAVNQGLPLSEARRGSKLEKLIGQLADRIAADALAEVRQQR
jgi:pilus assembly protein CpaE